MFYDAETAPTIISGIRGMKVLKTTQSSFVNFVTDAYRTLPDAQDRIFRYA
jgi:urate oxidase